MEQSENATSLLSEYLTKAELAAQLHRSIRSVDRWALTGDGPPCVRIGNTTLYRRESVLEWLRSRETTPVRPCNKQAGARSRYGYRGRPQKLPGDSALHRLIPSHPKREEA